MTTGNIYSQVYNSQSGRFEELPTGIIPIRVISTTGNFFGGSKLLAYNGISLSTFNTERILMYPIDIGSLNYNSGDGITVGYSNQIYNISPTGELGSESSPISLGENNLISGVESLIIGNRNIKFNSWYSYSLGKNNIEQDTAQIYIIGRDNGLSGALEVRAFGVGNSFLKSNTLQSSGIDVYNLAVIGDNNFFASGARYINLLGNNNSLINQSNYIGVFGNQNTASNTSGSYSLILGQSNTIESGDNIYILGFANTNRKSYDSYILGRGNILDSGDVNLVFGRFNQSVNASGNNLIGNSNTFDGDSNNVFGNTNNISLDSVSNIIFGNTNLFSGSNSNSIFGSRNSDKTSSSLSVIGSDNLTTSNANSYIIGQNNEYITNSNSYVIGNQNYAQNSNGSFVFGSANSVSGFQNYVIGNNNIIRSGDFNSILIGISHQPATGDFNYKVASVNIASVNNTIEVSPSDIKLTSANRPQINGENIIIQSEFDTISNALVQGPVFSTNTFQDPNYDKLADRIIFPYFVYDSGASIDNVSIEQEFTGNSFLFLDNFNIFSTTSYASPDFNVIYGNHTNTGLLGALSTPSWIVTDNSTSGIYYINTGTSFNITPQSGWAITGFEDGNGVIYTGKTANLQVNLKMGTRSGLMSTSSSSFGTLYVPFFY
jgi:hypothetical protein